MPRWATRQNDPDAGDQRVDELPQRTGAGRAALTPARDTRRMLSVILLFGGIYAAAAVVLTWPLSRHLSDHLVVTADSPMNAWILAWGVHALTHFPWRLLQANIFYPAPDALTFSDTLLGNHLLFAPVYAVTGNPVLAYNLTLLGAFVLNGLSLGLLARSITGQALPALVAGFVYAFAPLRFSHLVHLQLLSAWWAPLAFLALDAWLRVPRSSRLAGAVVAVWCQFLSSTYLGTMLAVLLVPYTVWRGWPDRRRLLALRGLRHLVAAGVLGVLLFLPVVMPYLRSQARWGHERGLEDQLRNSAQPTSFLAAFQTNWLYGDLTRPFSRREVPWESALFVGLVPLGLSCAGLIPRRRAGKAEGTDPCPIPRGYPLVAGLGVLLSLGPILILGDEPAQWPLPYLALYLWIPGFRGMRVPARFALIALVPLAVLSGVGTRRMLAWIRQRWPGGQTATAMLAVVALLAGITLESVHTPIRLQPVTDLDQGEPASSWLPEAAQGGAILEIPFAPFDQVREALRMLRSTQHWTPMVNGYSGFYPGSYLDLAGLVNGEGLTGPVLEALEALGIRTLVIHLDELPEAERHRWLQHPPWSRHLELIRSSPNLRLFRIKPAASRSKGLQAALAVPPTLPAGERFLVGLRLEEKSGGPWVNPGPLGLQPMTVTWTPARGSAPTRSVVPVNLPTLLPAGRNETTLLLLQTAEAPGAYRLEVQGAGLRIEQPIDLGVIPPEGQAYRAEVRWIGVPPSQVAAGDRVEVAVRLWNRGAGIWRESPGGRASQLPFRRLARLSGLTFWWASRELPDHGSEWRIWGIGQAALWIATPRSYLGRFTLRHRWLRDEQPVAADFMPLLQDVFPGQALDVHWIVPAPQDPGAHQLELTMQAPSLQPFPTANGAETLRIPIHVRRRDVGPP